MATSLATKSCYSAVARSSGIARRTMHLVPCSSLLVDAQRDDCTDSDQKGTMQDARLAAVELDWLYNEAAYDPTELAKALRSCGPAPWLGTQQPTLPSEFLF